MGREDLTGLVTESGVQILKYVGNNNHNKPMYLCKCSCGNLFTAIGSAVKNGYTKSCGCLSRQRSSEVHSLDISNKRFGRLVAIRRTEERRNGERVWECQCDCGNIVYVTTGNLTSGNTQSCGCLNSTKDLTNMVFGRLTVLERVSPTGSKRPLWRCRCSCGNECIVGRDDLESGSTRSCGCLQKERLRERSITHGISSINDRIYNIWKKMCDRCYNTSNKKYSNYGGRGIIVCDEWLDPNVGVINFYDWALANGYRDDLTIDRIDVNGPYAPWNCRWATLQEQSWNKTNTIRTIDGFSVIEYAHNHGLDRSIILKENTDITNITLEELHNRYFFPIEEIWL